MSTYMKALRRLEHDGQMTPSAIPARRRAVREAEEVSARQRATASAPAPAEVEALFGGLRTLAAPGGAARVLVFAPVAVPGAARGVVEALAARARELCLPVAVGELTRANGAALLASRGGDGRAPRPLDLDGPALAAGLREWVDAAAAPLVLLAAPPLLRSVDAVLLGAVCDGVVLVAETGATERGALRAAADRARDGGCRMLGVVLTRRDEG